MMKTYRHIRRKALDAAAKSLEPTFALEFPKHEERLRERGRFVPFSTATPTSDVTVTSQSDELDREVREIAEITRGLGDDPNQQGDNTQPRSAPNWSNARRILALTVCA